MSPGPIEYISGLLCQFDEVLEDQIQAWAESDNAAAVPRTDAVQLEEIIQHLRFTLVLRGVLCSVRALPHPQKGLRQL